MKRYEVIEDLQGGTFGMDRQYTAEEWLDQALSWLDADGWDVDDDGIAYWKSVIAEGREEELIGYIEETWDLEMREVEAE